MAAVTSLAIDGVNVSYRGNDLESLGLKGDPLNQPVEPSALSAVDLEHAKIAWNYFIRHTRPETGLVDSVENYPSTTLWDQSGYVFALVAAKKIGLIDENEFSVRTSMFLDSIERIELYDGRLPNKAYNTVSLSLVDYANQESEIGIGWSALDIARFLLSMRALEELAPDFAPQIRRIISSWSIDEMTLSGELYGLSVVDGAPRFEQEGRIGYEQYAARASALWGLDVAGALSSIDILAWKEIEGIEIPSDQRTFAYFHTIDPTLSEPYFLEAMELGLNHESEILASRVFEAQRARFENTGIPTVVSEDHLNAAPYFAYSSVYSNGAAWAVVTDSGERVDEMRTMSLKGLFAWDALYRTDYTADLMLGIDDLASADSGWYAGRYELDGSVNDVLTLNTNAVVLEAIHYRGFGPFWDF